MAKANVKHMTNEVLFNIVEEVNVALDQKGKPSVTDVTRVLNAHHGCQNSRHHPGLNSPLGLLAGPPCAQARGATAHRLVVPLDGTSTLCDYCLRDVTPIHPILRRRYRTPAQRFGEHSIGSRPHKFVSASGSSGKV